MSEAQHMKGGAQLSPFIALHISLIGKKYPFTAGLTETFS